MTLTYRMRETVCDPWIILQFEGDSHNDCQDRALAYYVRQDYNYIEKIGNEY